VEGFTNRFFSKILSYSFGFSTPDSKLCLIFKFLYARIYDPKKFLSQWFTRKVFLNLLDCPRQFIISDGFCYPL